MLCACSQFPIVVKEAAAVASVHFSGSVPHDFAVTSGSRVRSSDHDVIVQVILVLHWTQIGGHYNDCTSPSEEEKIGTFNFDIVGL